MARTEEQLRARMLQKDTQALAEFIERHRRQLLAYIDRSLGGGLRRKVEADDICQEMTVHALRALPETDLTNWDPLSWLCQIAEQRIIDAHRRFFGAQKRAADREVPILGRGTSSSHQGLIELLVSSMTTPSQAFSRGQKELQLLGALATLPEEAQEAIRLRYVEGLPSKLIAQRMGKTDGAIRVLLTRSIKRLQQLMGPAK